MSTKPLSAQERADTTEADEYRIHDTDGGHVTVKCRDCAWTNTNPPLQANAFADSHEDRHGHEVSR